jgi:hypothetical protein
MFIAHNKSIVNLKFVASVSLEDRMIKFFSDPVTTDYPSAPLIARWVFDSDDEWRRAVNNLEDIMDVSHC